MVGRREAVRMCIRGRWGADVVANLHRLASTHLLSVDMSESTVVLSTALPVRCLHSSLVRRCFSAAISPSRALLGFLMA